MLACAFAIICMGAPRAILYYSTPIREVEEVGAGKSLLQEALTNVTERRLARLIITTGGRREQFLRGRCANASQKHDHLSWPRAGKQGRDRQADQRPRFRLGLTRDAQIEA